jgi:hypothetical protein
MRARMRGEHARPPVNLPCTGWAVQRSSEPSSATGLPVPMRFPVAVFLLAAPALTLAQERPGPRAPRAWVSLGAGYLHMDRVHDGTSGSVWDFRSSWPVRLAVEARVSRTVTAGASVMRARVPLVYDGGGACVACRAHATVLFAGPLLRMQRDIEVLEVGAGVMSFSDFSVDATGAPLRPGRNSDFAAHLGIGVALPLSPSLRAELMYAHLHDYHDRRYLPPPAPRVKVHRTVRLAVRRAL